MSKKFREFKYNVFCVGYDENKINIKKIRIVTFDGDPYNKWMNYILFDGTFKESKPMQTEFRCPILRLYDMRKTMTEHGYKEELIN